MWVLPIDAAIQANLREATTRVLATLTPREERVLRMRFRHRHEHRSPRWRRSASNSRSPASASARSEAKALRKLRHPSRSRKLRSFLDN